MERAKGEGNLPLLGFKDPKDFVQALKRPRRIVILVQAGSPGRGGDEARGKPVACTTGMRTRGRTDQLGLAPWCLS